MLAVLFLPLLNENDLCHCCGGGGGILSDMFLAGWLADWFVLGHGAVVCWLGCVTFHLVWIAVYPRCWLFPVWAFRFRMLGIRLGQ